MLFEDRIASFADLGKRLRTLDQDAGVRLIGGSGSKRYLTFVTRFGRKYTVMTYAMGKKGAPGKRLETLEFETPEGIDAFLRRSVKGRLQAWVY